MARGPRAFSSASRLFLKNPCFLSGARPPYPRRPWLLPLTSFAPVPGRGAIRAFCPLFAAGDKGSLTAFAASRPCALALVGRSRVRPLRLRPWGAGFWVPPVPFARSRRAFRRSCGGGWVALFVRCRLLGVLCPLPLLLSRRSPRPWCVPLALPLRRGPVPPWVCRSGLRAGRFPVSWRWSGFRRRSRRAGFPVRGVAGWFPWSAFVRCAPRPLRLAVRRRGWFRFRWLRRLRWWAGVALPVRWLPRSRLQLPARRCRVVAPALFPAAAPAVVGFSGGRRLSPVFRPRVSGVVAEVLASGRSVAVGCAAGADAFVRAAAPSALVFSVPGSGRRPAAWFAARSVALVRSVAAAGPGSGFVAFPAAPCPAGLSPSPSAAACFCGLGSGSWASAALAAGLGVPLVVFPCGFSALPPWGVWRPAGAGVWAGGFLLR